MVNKSEFVELIPKARFRFNHTNIVNCTTNVIIYILIRFSEILIIFQIYIVDRIRRSQSGEIGEPVSAIPVDENNSDGNPCESFS